MTSATFGALMAKTAECNKLHRALELACSYLTDEQVKEISAAMPEASAGYVLLPKPITEEMHVAACKVLTRATGLDGLPQRMLDAMSAAA